MLTIVDNITAIAKLKASDISKAIGKYVAKYTDCGEHYTAYQSGKDIINVLSMFIGLGEIKEAVKSGKFFETLANTTLKKMGNTARASVRLVYGIRNLGIQSIKIVRKAGSKIYNITVKGSNKVIAVIENGVIRVRRWVDISGGKGKKLSTRPLDDSPDGKFLAQTEDGTIGICKANGKGGFLFETPGLQITLQAEQLTKLQKVAWKESNDALEFFIHADGARHIAYIENAQGVLKPIDIKTEDLANVIRAIDPTGSKPVRFLSCSNMEAAEGLSKALGDRTLYAIEGIVRVHVDGGITVIARSGNKTQKWRKLQKGKQVADAPTPKKSGQKAKKEFVEMGLLDWLLGGKKKMPVPEKLVITQLDDVDVRKLKQFLDRDNYKVVEAKQLTSDEWKELIKLLEGDTKKLNNLINVTPFENIRDLTRLLTRNNSYNPGIFKNVSALKKHKPAKGWKIFTPTPVRKGNITTIETYVTYGRVEKKVIRSYNHRTGEFVMESAFLKDNKSSVPGMIPVKKGKLTEIRVPTITYINLHQMKVLGLKAKSITVSYLKHVVNDATNLQLAWLIKKFPEKSIEELFKLTPSYKYAQTIYIQSGHVIEGIAIVNIPTRFRSKLDGDAIDKIAGYNKAIFNDKSMTPKSRGFVEGELTKYQGLKMDDYLPSNYHVYFILKPVN